MSIEIDEEAVPIHPAVASACEFLGLDPLYIANEGKLIVIVEENASQEALSIIRACKYGENAAVIGHVTAEQPGLVSMRTAIGGMKSQLDARPVYLQKQETITGHFLICYLAVLLTRILQIHILKNQYGTEEIFDFIRDFRVAKISDRKYINLSRNSSFIKFFSDHTGLPLTSYFMGNTDIKKVLSHRF